MGYSCKYSGNGIRKYGFNTSGTGVCFQHVMLVQVKTYLMVNISLMLKVKMLLLVFVPHNKLPKKALIAGLSCWSSEEEQSLKISFIGRNNA